MTQPALRGMFSDDPPASSVTTSPIARAARRSGRQRVVSTIRARMAAYRNALVTLGPRDDHDMMLALMVPLSTVCAIRGDWKLYAAHHTIPNPIQAFDRQRKVWGSGHPTSRTRWQWVE